MIQKTKFALATNNSHKKEEFQNLLRGFHLEIITPKDLGISFDPIESAPDFEGNARIKAQALWEATGFSSLADDSGISVRALGGRPGVHSARYGGEGKTDEERALLLLEEMEGKPDRAAHYTCVLCYTDRSGSHLFRGEVHGEIALDYDSKGKFGFGYDPIFHYPPFGLRFSQIPLEQKNTVSHRKLALDSFLEWFSKNQPGL